MVLTPSLLFGLITLPKTNFIRRFGKLMMNLLLVYICTLAPFLIYGLLNGIQLSTFFQDQLFNTQAFSFTPNLVLPIDELSTLFLLLGSVLLVAYLLLALFRKKKLLGAKVVFLLLFITVSFVYTPYFDYQYVWIDPDQLNSFYAVLICVFLGLSLHFLLTIIDMLGSRMKKVTPYVGPVITASMASWFFWLQGGVEVSGMLPQTEPNGFYDAYYNIINERVPYTYATVGPEIDRDLAKNRHFFMSYKYFLDNYGVIDSLYQQYLTVPKVEKSKIRDIPPASIFLFVEKPPYGSIQQGILYNAQGVMRDMEQWLASFKRLENRTVRTYHETEETVVYEIVNREGESTINGVLRNVYPKEKGRAARLLE